MPYKFTVKGDDGFYFIGDGFKSYLRGLDDEGFSKTQPANPYPVYFKDPDGNIIRPSNKPSHITVTGASADTTYDNWSVYSDGVIKISSTQDYHKHTLTYNSAANPMWPELYVESPIMLTGETLTAEMLQHNAPYHYFPNWYRSEPDDYYPQWYYDSHRTQPAAVGDVITAPIRLYGANYEGGAQSVTIGGKTYDGVTECKFNGVNINTLVVDGVTYNF